jgi:hypothetical protein
MRRRTGELTDSHPPTRVLDAGLVDGPTIAARGRAYELT